MPRRRLRSLVPRVLSVSFVLCRDRHKETRKPEVNQPSSITARHPRTHEWRSRPTAEQERNIPQAVLFGAQAANSRREPSTKHGDKTVRQAEPSTKHGDKSCTAGVGQSQNTAIEPHDRCEPIAKRGNRTTRAAQNSPRAHYPRAGLYPADCNISPARHSRACKAE